MKLSYAGAGVALILAATLAACGGKAQFTVQGTISNLKNAGLVLTNGGNTLSVPAGATSFAFPQQIDYGSSFNIAIQKQPDHMTCQIGGNTGSAGHNVSIAAQIVCDQNTYPLSGKFTGLTPAADAAATVRTVTLVNGSTGGGVTISSTATGSGDFVLSPNVPDGQAYGVTVLDPANGLVCTLTNGTGVMHEEAIGNLVLTCAPK